jgi:transcriptional regulator with XRE-family HTH domain
MSDNVGSLLKALRKQHKLTQLELAEILMTDQTVVSLLENNKMAMDMKYAKRLGEKFNVDYRLYYSG